MTTQPDYSKIYTHTPEQHPNLILGSLQMLFWIFYRPTAWRTYLLSIDPALHPDFQSWKQLQRKQFSFWKLMIQGYLILPVLFNLLSNILMYLFMFGTGKSLEKLVYSIAISVLIASGFGISFGITVNISFGIISRWAPKFSVM